MLLGNLVFVALGLLLSLSHSAWANFKLCPGAFGVSKDVIESENGSTVSIPKATMAYVDAVAAGLNNEILELDPFFSTLYPLDLPVIGMNPIFMRNNGIAMNPNRVIRIHFRGGYVRARIIPLLGAEPDSIILSQQIASLLEVEAGYAVILRPDRDETDEEKQYSRFLWARPNAIQN